MISPTKAALGLVLATAFAIPAHAGDFVTKAQVDRSGGFNIALKDGSVARIMDIRPPKGEYKECHVDIPSVRKLAQEAQDNQKYGHVPIRLRARMGSIGTFFCMGKGNGCLVIVMVPTPHA